MSLANTHPNSTLEPHAGSMRSGVESDIGKTKSSAESIVETSPAAEVIPTIGSTPTSRPPAISVLGGAEAALNIAAAAAQHRGVYNQ